MRLDYALSVELRGFGLCRCNAEFHQSHLPKCKRNKMGFSSDGLPSRSLGERRKFATSGPPLLHSGVAAFTVAPIRAKAGPDWARTSDPALIKRML